MSLLEQKLARVLAPLIAVLLIAGGGTAVAKGPPRASIAEFDAAARSCAVLARAAEIRAWVDEVGRAEALERQAFFSGCQGDAELSAAILRGVFATTTTTTRPPPSSTTSSTAPATTTTTTAPDSPMEISPGESIQAAVDAHPGPTIFLIRSGVHTGQQVRPHDGQTFIGEPGAVLDGGGTVAHAFHGLADDVTIRGLVIQHYRPGRQRGAIHPQDGDQARWGERWTVADNEVRENTDYGVRTAPGMHAVGNRIHDNGQMGLGGNLTGGVVENNEVAFNHTDGVDPLVEASGSKFSTSSGAIVRGNHYHGNKGPGIWFDIDNIDCVIEGNLVEDNDGPGIEWEISAAGVIRGNRVLRNGLPRRVGWLWEAGILVANSFDVEVYGNYLEGNATGIAGVHQNRGQGRYGPRALRNLWVHDNELVATGITGVVQDTGSRDVFGGWANRFDRNRYRGGAFEWENGVKPWHRWRSFGHDAAGTFTS